MRSGEQKDNGPGASLAGPRIAGLRSKRTFLPEPLTAFFFLSPVILLFGLSVIYPVIETVRISFWEIRGLGKPHYVGLENYIRLFADPVFLKTLWTTLIFTLGVTAFSVGIGWSLALLCAFAPKRTSIFRLMIFATFGISEAVAGYIWISIFRPGEAGLLNGVLTAIGLGDLAQPWLGGPETALVALVVTASWSAVGLPLLLSFASVQAIPRSVLEAAYVDGAKPLTMMWHIMMPLSLPGARVAVFLTLLSSLRAFDIVFVLTAGGPARSTETVGFFMYRESMTQFNLGYGAAATIILLIAVLIVSTPAIAQRTKGAK
ncbi:sugar ABC transporter permease (plasmid) [Rhizobium leguminosarum]|nr:sugar ABC transporter permease [Rhizobium leguminosarum]TBG93447.1 sugar ABC transporter permease [Rhizobium leguminosarum]TBG95932.1 sugar ABC transporter permease [Rhizobium leguminosarum]TBH28826.1 sugar ABC transporter permease [Rhizobium leguminosarum]TBH50272.1 sugar ABC transporter permease [Rhizobium leguminosarum]